MSADFFSGYTGQTDGIEEGKNVTIDEIRRQLHSIKTWPIFLCADGTWMEIPSLDEVAIPTAGNLLGVFHNGAFIVVDCGHVSAISSQPLANVG